MKWRVFQGCRWDGWRRQSAPCRPIKNLFVWAVFRVLLIFIGLWDGIDKKNERHLQLFLLLTFYQHLAFKQFNPEWHCTYNIGYRLQMIWVKVIMAVKILSLLWGDLSRRWVSANLLCRTNWDSPLTTLRVHLWFLKLQKTPKGHSLPRPLSE